MKRLALFCCAVATLACAGKDDDAAFERSEISDAINAQESLTVHFTDSVKGRLPQATTTAHPATTSALVADACTLVDSIAVASWRRRELGALPVTLLLPAAYSRVPREAKDPPDSMSQTFRTPDGDEVIAMRRSNAFDLVDVPEWGKESSCLVDVEKMRVHVETGSQVPSGDPKTLSASFHLPTGGWFVLHGRAHDIARQREQLRVVREVRFVHLWQRALP